MNKPICLFDSGIGGLTVLKKLINRFPNENYIYLADLARVPFGDKTKDEVKIIVDEIIEWLLKFDPKIMIMACNTSSALFFEEYKNKLQIPVHGTIISCAKEIADSNYSKVSIWATKLVTESQMYTRTIQGINPGITVQEIACQKLVPMIEDLSFNQTDKDSIILEYLDKTPRDSEAIVLGCTHYPHLHNNLLRLTDQRILDPADSLIKELENNIQENNSSFKNQVSLYTTAQVEKIEKFSRLYLCGNYKTGLISLNKSKATV